MSSDGKVSASVNAASGVPQDSVLGPLLFILYTSGLFHIVRDYIAVMMILRSMQLFLFLGRVRVLSDEIAESGFGSNQLLCH